MSRLATWIVAVLLVAAACGDSVDTTTSAPPDTAPATTTTLAPTTTVAPTTTTVPPPTTAPPPTGDVLAEIERRILAAGIVGGGVPVSREEAACLAQVINDNVGGIDVDGASALLSGSADDPLAAVTPAQADAILTGGAECVDIIAQLEAEAPAGVDPQEYVLQAIAEGVLEGAADDPTLDVNEEEARCVGQGMFDTFGFDGIEALALADLLGIADPDSVVPGASDEQLAGFVQVMLGCVDFAALLSATFQQDGISAESADCAAEAMLEATFFEDLVVQLALGEEAFPDDPEIVAEVVQLLLDCLTPEELADLADEG